jgi:hypothetical protein
MFAVKGAKYFIAQKSMLNKKPDFEQDLRRIFPVVSECDEFILFDLTN